MLYVAQAARQACVCPLSGTTTTAHCAIAPPIPYHDCMRRYSELPPSFPRRREPHLALQGRGRCEASGEGTAGGGRVAMQRSPLGEGENEGAMEGNATKCNRKKSSPLLPTRGEATRGYCGSTLTSERRAKRGHSGLNSSARLGVNEANQGQMGPKFDPPCRSLLP